MILQSQSQLLRPMTTAHLAQTMTLMGLTSQELRQKIEAELASNPALELIEDHYCPSCHRPLPYAGVCPICSRQQGVSSDEPIVFVSPREDFYSLGSSRISPEDMPDEELGAEVVDLPQYVLRQIAPELPPEDRAIAAHILTGLDEDGLLRTPIVEIARYHHVLPSRVQSVQRLIQRAEPIGVGSTSPQEALLVQLEILSETMAVPALAAQAIRESMGLLSRHQYIELGRQLGITTAKARQIAQFIGDNLNPYPARAHWGDIHQSAEPANDVYTIPDVIISQLNQSKGSSLVVEVISPLVGKLRINPLFRQSLNEAPPDKLEQWQKDIEQAQLLIKCIQQRDNTIVRLMQRLAVIQREFILRGDAYLAPITRASLAEELDVHESTISRAVSNKAVQLPWGRIIPLSKFFDRSLHIRTALCQIIATESKPLTDTQIAKLLNKQGYPIARRTVAKYRAMEGILPAHLRNHTRPVSPQIMNRHAVNTSGAIPVTLK
jgi:RNA polymerase sigma-54 factor